MTRRPPQVETPIPRYSDAPSSAWDARLEIIIAVALGLAAIFTAGAVYLNEHQDHEATLEFHHSTHELVRGASMGLRTPAGRAHELTAQRFSDEAESHQEKAANYTLAEVILATSLFLFGVAGISNRWRIKVGAVFTATGVFLVALVVLATV